MECPNNHFDVVVGDVTGHGVDTALLMTSARAFLILAAAKTASNHLQDAAKVADEVRRVEPDFTLEKFAETQPYKNPETLQQLLITLRRAGLQ